MSAESASQMLETPMYQLYASVAPNLDNGATQAGKLGICGIVPHDFIGFAGTYSAPANG